MLIAISVVAKRLAKKYEDKSKEWYQLDPLGQYNDEIIHEHSYDDFVKALNELTFEDVEWYFDDLDKEEYERD